MDFDVDIRFLSSDFYKAYPEEQYPELMRKNGRPYTCLLIDTHQSYLICVPFRTSIKHREAFLFSGTKRSSQSRSGLDYKKIVLVEHASYIDEAYATVDSDEYRETIRHINRIAAEADSYINDYVRHISGEKRLHDRDFSRRYQYSTLPYFHDILGLATGI